MTRPLANGYVAECDGVDSSTWYNEVAGFGDASLYQLWQYGTGRDRFTDVSRLFLKRQNAVIAAAEIRLFRLPLTDRGIAYVLWGPLWRRRSITPDPEVFRQSIRALSNEYVARRGMVLRINLRLFVEEETQQYLRILSDEGFSQVSYLGLTKSLIVDLTSELGGLRKGLASNWRRHLKKAEQAGLTVAVGTGVELFDEFTVIYEEMLRRKRFSSTADIYKHRRVQVALPDKLKMVILLARYEGRACAGQIFSALGDTAVFLFAATNELGMRTSGSYLVQWNALRLLKEAGIKYCDLNGVNPDSNPGTYHFKEGLAGRNGKQVTFVGQFQALSGSIINHSLLLIDRLRYRIRNARERRARASA
jgi:hypothetical protein